MKKKPFVLRSSIVVLSAMTFAAPSTFGVLNETFTVDPVVAGTAVATQLADAPGAAVMPDPLDPNPTPNSILRFLDGLNNLHNHYSFNRTDTGAWEQITASFDFRITPGSNGLADGFGFMLIPTSVYGESGDGPAPLAEEPNVLGTFGIGIDVYQNINNIRTHWDNRQINDINPSFVSDFRNNQVFNNVQVVLQRVGNATNATITITNDSLGAAPGTPTKIMETVLPNMLPYENRVHFAGRTGGENLRLDLDNVKVNYATEFVGGLPVAPTGHLFQDFDSIGTTSYRTFQATTTDLTTFRPGPLIKAAEPGSNGAFLRIVNDGVAGQNNRVAFLRGIDAGATNMTEVLRLDVRFNSTDQPADGMGLLFLRTREIAGASNFDNAGINSNEEPNHQGMLGIGIDVFDNDGPGTGEPPAGLSLHWNNSKLEDVPLPAEFALGQFHRLEVTREPFVQGGIAGLRVSVTAVPNINGGGVTPITLINQRFIAGASNYDYRVQLSGRTGGSNADHDIDNIVSSQIARPILANTQANFTETTGSGWKGYAFGTGAAPEVRNEFDLNGNFLRLAHDGVNSQSNAVTFDKQLDGTVAGKTGIVADFNFRMQNGADVPADGMSLMLIPTATFGNTGAGAAATPGFIAEEPNVPGVFGIGLDIYEGAVANQVSIHWDGTVVDNGVRGEFNVDTGLINLTSGSFHRLHLELTQDAAGMLLDLILKSDILGLPGADVVLANDYLIPGMSIYDYRVEFAARTGGLNISVDIDDVLVQTIPEPGSAVLLGLGGLLLARRRRRS
jgi:hypothetical protein